MSHQTVKDIDCHNQQNLSQSDADGLTFWVPNEMYLFKLAIFLQLLDRAERVKEGQRRLTYSMKVLENCSSCWAFVLAVMTAGIWLYVVSTPWTSMAKSFHKPSPVNKISFAIQQSRKGHRLTVVEGHVVFHGLFQLDRLAVPEVWSNHY